ncbi:podoplanin [Oryzias melastigma]|uniref:podoplanin n=1 Tax=Oryzias melastigma TaxID=30732 RepID=UPI000CF838E1|nr:podoplanin [Oryzias melastigma]
MKVQLLLLVALAGPFCAVTSASPTFPTELRSASPEENQTPSADSPVLGPVTEVITGPPPTLPEVLPEILSETQPATTAAPTAKDESFVFTESRGIFTEPVTEAATQAAETEAPAEETEAPAEETSAADAVTNPPALDSETPAESVEEQTEGLLGDEVTVDEESLSSGQIIGIVIGALLAVVIVIAVVIAVVRRMGKYSSAKSRKTAKKDSAVVSPLRKKPSKQKQSAKFWRN